MWISIILLPVLAATCLGAAIPKRQEIVSATDLGGRPQDTYTIVVPCYDTPECVPQTLTLEARNPVPQQIVTVSRTVIVGPTPPSSTKPSSKSTKKSTSKKPTIKPTSGYPTRTVSIKPRQVLGDPTRTVPHWPGFVLSSHLTPYLKDRLGEHS